MFGGCVALGLCNYLPAVDYRLLFMGLSRRDNGRSELRELTYYPTAEIIEFRSLAVLLLLIVAVISLYWYHWHNQRSMRQQRKSELITID